MFLPRKSLEFLPFDLSYSIPKPQKVKVNLKLKKKMFESIIRLFAKEKTDYAQLVKDGAVILDVRTKGEFASGHIRGSVNIAAEQLGNNLHKLKNKTKPIITCCESGMRSSVAKNILKSNGYTNVYNGGGINRLQNKL